MQAIQMKQRNYPEANGLDLIIRFVVFFFQG